MNTQMTALSPLARHGQLRTRGPLSQVLKLVAVAMAVVMVSGVSIAAYVLHDFSSTVTANSVDLGDNRPVPAELSGYEGGFDLLVVGIDKCEEKYAELLGKRCVGRVSDHALNDVNLLVHVSDAPRRVTAVSFPRDLMVPIPACTTAAGVNSPAVSMQPLNNAYSRGGLSCVAKTISEFTGQDVEFAASVTFGGVIEITDAVGGVDVCLATGIKDTKTNLDMAAGTHTVKGLEALQFLRTRHGVGDGSDLGRIGNQQQYMSSLARKLISSDVLGDVPTLMRLATAALSNLEASTSLTENPMTVVQIALAVKNVDFSDIVFVQYPNGSDADYPNKVVPNYDAAAVLWQAINANQRLEITHKNNGAEGVVVQGEVPPVSPSGGPEKPAPSDEAVALPKSIKGNSAAQQTCSNGNRR